MIQLKHLKFEPIQSNPFSFSHPFKINQTATRKIDLVNKWFSICFTSNILKKHPTHNNENQFSLLLETLYSKRPFFFLNGLRFRMQKQWWTETKRDVTTPLFPIHFEFFFTLKYSAKRMIMRFLVFFSISLCRPNAIPITYLFHFICNVLIHCCRFFEWRSFKLLEMSVQHAASFDIYVRAKASVWDSEIFRSCDAQPIKMYSKIIELRYRSFRIEWNTDWPDLMPPSNSRVFVYFAFKQKRMSHYLFFSLIEKWKRANQYSVSFLRRMFIAFLSRSVFFLHMILDLTREVNLSNKLLLWLTL